MSNLRRGIVAPAIVLLLAATAAPLSAQAPAQSPAVSQPVPSPPLATLDAHRVVPVPANVTVAAGEPFVFSANTKLVTDGPAELTRTGEYLARILRKSTALRLPVSGFKRGSPSAGNVVLLRVDTSAVASVGTAPTARDEGYTLDIAADTIRLVARTPAGVFFGVATLRQLLPWGIEAEQSALRLAPTVSVPPGRIVDSPRFAWRGSMLDVARHFFTVDEVKQHIDLMALYKFNRLHLHLADDQGWRIAIASWPKLTQVGGSSEVGGASGGFYTKADYAEIVRYAAARHIMVVPEIDMPGHSNAAIAAYPQLGCSRPTPNIYGEGTQSAGVYTGIRVGWSALCPDKALTWRFVNDVVREIASITPGPYFHIGGDEVEVLNHTQYARFVERVQAIVHKHGKTMVGWEEVGKATLRQGSIAQLWRSDTALLAVKQGNQLIMSPGPRTYLDMKYTPATEVGLRWAGYIELRTAYDWDPATYSAGLSEQAILGVEAPLWSETVRNLNSAQYLLVPRLPALAEVAWSAQAARSWEGFRTRIATHAARWRLLGINFYASPQVEWAP
ncbi:beta-N-acetylhexosaminidase [Gemmatimonas groenlandica]|uniref:beta-N-acetylhexosaminidase n=1 Tax=Gemmatimonas groenlandica TaxID=2732249 RepID=A0A6M4ISA0_9BACT|nr:beta-N-acetylhexosaminidase [Gemmatimonas groenlandica]QJR35692.1 family 20 glycosylhydrolase [Gemmatimonas groenlandica]